MKLLQIRIHVFRDLLFPLALFPFCSLGIKKRFVENKNSKKGMRCGMKGMECFFLETGHVQGFRKSQHSNASFTSDSKHDLCVKFIYEKKKNDKAGRSF